MSGKTGEKCASSGQYHCQTHVQSVISMKVGDTFPMCTFGGGAVAAHKTTWVKDEPLPP
jgi:hypothetical protein